MMLRKQGARLLWSVPVGLQLAAVYTVLLTVILALLGAALYAQLDGFLISNTADRLEQAASATLLRSGGPGRDTGRSGDFGNGGNSRPTPTAMDTYRAANLLVQTLSGHEVQVGVYDASGTALSSTTPPDGSTAAALPAIPAAWQAQPVAARQPLEWVVTTPEGSRALVLLTAVSQPASDNQPATYLLVEQVASLEGGDAVLAELRLFVILGIGVGTVLGVGAGLSLTRVVLRPLDRLAATAEAIATGDLGRRVQLPPGRNEIARLGHSFDYMVDQLAAALESQRRFVADASHELRTPLTSLEGLSELLLMGADRGDSRVVQRTVRAMHGELGRLGRLVADLLTLSRPEAAPAGGAPPLDAGTVLAGVAEQLEPLAAERGVSLVVQAAPDLWVAANADRLKQVILNLVDNALRYTPAGGTVTLRGGQDAVNGGVCLEVADTGPGIAPADLPHVFDRFYRGDLSRARATGNSGLGLAIVRNIVEAHGGRIGVESTPGQGARFMVTLPTPAQAAAAAANAGAQFILTTDGQAPARAAIIKETIV
jgi:signal transduction histidine kinase